MKRFFKHIFDFGWSPVTDGKGWGIYHATKWHRWSYDMTKKEAIKKCNELNS
jgi:hypothetical protein